MGQLTAMNPRTFATTGFDLHFDMPMAATTIYGGSALSDTGSATPGQGTNTVEQLVAGENFAGFADINDSVTAAVAGTQTVRVRTMGIVQLVVTGATAASLFSPVYASDGNTFTTTRAGNSFVGIILQIVSGTTVLVYFDGRVRTTGVLVDNTGGVVGTTLAADLATTIVKIGVPALSALANAQTLSVDPGFAGAILAVNFRVGATPASTASKLATLTAEVAGTGVTGGVVALTTAACNAAGALVAGTAITAANTFTKAQAIGVTVSSVTTFVEGGGEIELILSNTDLLAAIASIAALIN